MNFNTEQAIQLAAQWYSKEKLAHVMRVANYALEEAELLGYDEHDKETIFQIGILHDILEDTECPKNTVLNVLKYTAPMGALGRLTHLPDETYPEYILRLSKYEENDLKDDETKKAIAFAYIVKRADMKDHLMLEETLSDKLKEKYFPIVKYIL